MTPLSRTLIGCLIVTGSMASAHASAQMPTFSIKLDVRASLYSRRDGDTAVRFYTPLGKPSTVGIEFSLQQDVKVFVTEKFYRIPGDGDPEQMDEYYATYGPNLRIGKQYVPFGSDLLMRQSLRGVSIDTYLPVLGIPARFAVFDNGPGYSQGAIARVGDDIALSVGIGKYLGIASTALTPIRRPEDAPGARRGYESLYGLSYRRQFKSWTIDAEWVSMRDGATSMDPSSDASILKISRAIGKSTHLGAFWARSWRRHQDYFAVQGSIPLGELLSIEPFVRYQNHRVHDAALTLRLKL